MVGDAASSFVSIKGFHITRGDTDNQVRKHGVGLYIKCNLKFIEVDVDIPNVAAVLLCDWDLNILAVYHLVSYRAEECCPGKCDF